MSRERTMRVAIRDDDACAFTRPDDLERAYAPTGGNLPVSVAVTPFAVESFHLGDPARFFQKDQELPLSENGEMAGYLKAGIRSGRFSVLCHGYSHEYKRNSRGGLVQECVWKDDERLVREGVLAKRHLEETLGCAVRTFVPPGNAMRVPAIQRLGHHFPRILATVPMRRWREFLVCPRTFGSLARRVAGQFRYGAPPPAPERLGPAWLLPSMSLTASSDWSSIADRFALHQRLEGDLVVAVHYWELRGATRDLFHRFLEHAVAQGATFTHCDDLFPAMPEPADTVGSVKEEWS
ncbi:MAG: DUF2334 domain-containing protein [Bryobacterales bacterium]|nr:DUF2334 domain-containing protein [Bryobacterales bacterium]